MNWTIDPTHSSITFSIRHMVFAKVRGSFTQWTAELDLREPVEQSKVTVKIDPRSINTGVDGRDNHLRSPDFFDVEKFPEMTFVSRNVISRGDDSFGIEGDLTIRGTTVSVTLDAQLLGRGKDPWGNQRAAFSAKTRLDRRAFGLTWNQALETGGVLVGEHIDVEVDLEAVAQSDSLKKAS